MCAAAVCRAQRRVGQGRGDLLGWRVLEPSPKEYRRKGMAVAHTEVAEIPKVMIDEATPATGKPWFDAEQRRQVIEERLPLEAVT
ncbi:MAG: hypothetical protein AB7E12_14145 [Burkholderiaceae bacterium]